MSLKAFTLVVADEASATRVAGLGLPVVRAQYRAFADKEAQWWLPEMVAANTPVAIVARVPEELFQLALLADAAKRAGASTVWAFAPFVGYMRQDKIERIGDAPAASQGMAVIGKLLAACVEGVFTYAPHSPEGLELWPAGLKVTELEAFAPLAEAILKENPSTDWVVVATDEGGVPRAKAFANLLGAATPVAQIEKYRTRPNEVASAQLVQGSVKGKHALLVDDMIDTAGTLVAAAKICRENGATAVSAAAVHGIFSPPAAARLQEAAFQHLWVLDTRAIANDIHAKVVNLQ